MSPNYGVLIFWKSQPGMELKNDFAPVCSELIGKFNETNGDFLASLVFSTKPKNPPILWGFGREIDCIQH